jgi:hypothetical protein
MTFKSQYNINQSYINQTNTRWMDGFNEKLRTYPTSFLDSSTTGFGFSGSFLMATFLLFLEAAAGPSSPESSKAAKKLLD